MHIRMSYRRVVDGKLRNVDDVFEVDDVVGMQAIADGFAKEVTPAGNPRRGKGSAADQVAHPRSGPKE